MFTTLASTYFAGFLTSLTPCVYPMIPLSLGYLGSKAGGLKKRIIFAFTFGQVAMFCLLGLVAVQLGDVFGSLSENRNTQFFIGSLLAVFTYYSWKEKLPAILIKLNNIKSKSSAGLKPEQSKLASLTSAFGAGFISTLVASPCSTPVLGGVLLMISKSESSFEGIGLMFMYGFGVSTIFMVLGLGLLKTKGLPKSGLWMKRVHSLSVLLLAGSSVFFMGKGFGVWG